MVLVKSRSSNSLLKSSSLSVPMVLCSIAFRIVCRSPSMKLLLVSVSGSLS